MRRLSLFRRALFLFGKILSNFVARFVFVSFWRRLFLLLLPNSFDDVEKTLLFWREEKPLKFGGDDGGFEGRAETRGNAEEASRAAGRRKTSSPSFKVVQ